MHVAAAASKLSPLKPKVGAAIVRGGRVLSVGFNRPGSSKLSASRYSRHAEVAAIIAGGDVRGGTIYVFRSHAKTGVPLLAKPCRDCQDALELAGIRKVVFSGG